MSCQAEDALHNIADAQLTATMIWCLDAALSICGRGSRPFLRPDEASLAVRYLRGHQLAYQQLAAQAFSAGSFYWKLRPKWHYLVHLTDNTEAVPLNCMAFANFLDEDFMKQMRSCVHACHPASMLRTWSRRYILKRVLVWDRLKKTCTREFLSYFIKTSYELLLSDVLL